MPENLEPNLLSDQPNLLNEDQADYRNLVIYTRVLKIFIVIVVGLFLLLSTVSLVLNGFLGKLKNDQNLLTQRLSPLTVEESYLTETVSKITSYKDTLEKRLPLSAKTSFVLSKITPDTQVQQFSINKSSFEVMIKSNGAYSVTKLISSYLKDKSLTEIRLKSASIDSNNDMFSVDMEGVFR